MVGLNNARAKISPFDVQYEQLPCSHESCLLLPKNGNVFPKNMEYFADPELLRS